MHKQCLSHLVFLSLRLEYRMLFSHCSMCFGHFGLSSKPGSPCSNASEESPFTPMACWRDTIKYLNRPSCNVIISCSKNSEQSSQ